MKPKIYYLQNRAIHKARAELEDKGVFLVEAAEELEEYLDNLKKRALSTLHRMATLKCQHLPELLGQIRLEVENDLQR